MPIRIALLISLALTLAVGQTTSSISATTPSEPASTLFIENVGQFPSAARFRAYGGGYTLWLAEDGLWLTVLAPHPSTQSGVHLKLTFLNANPHARLEFFNPQPTQFNYFHGDAAQWRTDVPTWGGIRYVDLYPGVDLEVVGGATLWRLVARPGASLAAVRLHVAGAGALTLDGNVLRLTTVAGDVTLPLLSVTAGGDFSPAPTILGGDVLHPFTHVSTPTAPQDFPSALRFSTFLGGNGDECRGFSSVGPLQRSSCEMTLDPARNIYIVGDTTSTNFPTTPGAFDRSLAAQDAFVVKMNPTGSALVFATFLGGAINEAGHDIMLAANSIYVAGMTSSNDFPTTPGAYDTSHNNTDVFITRLNASGSTLLYSTLLGGNNPEEAPNIFVDGAGQVYVTGATSSLNFPITPGAFDASKSPNARDAFVTKFNTAGSALLYSTFLGGGSHERAYAITVDNAGQAYVTGQTSSSDFPTTAGAIDRTFAYVLCPDGLPCEDAFVAKLNSGGTGLIYGTYLGGQNSSEGIAYDSGYAIAVDGAGNAYVGGETRNPDFPTTPGAYDTSQTGARDGFIAKINPTGTALLYSTHLGAWPEDAVWGLYLDGMGDVYVAGFTTAVKNQPFPTTLGAYASALDADFNPCVYQQIEATPCAQGFVSKLRLGGQGAADLLFSTVIGGIADHDATWNAIPDGTGNVVVMGRTVSAVFPTTPGAFDITYNGGDVEYGDAFIAKISAATATTLNTDTSVGTIPFVGARSGGIANVPIEYGNLGLTPANSVVLTATLAAGLTYANDNSGISPVVAGNKVVWSLPAQIFPNRSNFGLRLNVPNAPLGTQYLVTWTISSLGVEFDPSNNTDTTQVRVSLLTFLPLTQK